ncbi:N-glycosylase/DNA lyase [Candidatus Pacearchaeota archaeon]|nr:N-glycosylase/DNA lyase [Candidatus Pacearchaeota archaeon]
MNVINLIEELRNSPIRSTIDSRIKEFDELGKKSDQEIFKELCFCFLTANFSASGGIKIQNDVNDGFLYLSEEELAEKLSSLSHRFPNARAKFIVEARKHKDTIKQTLKNFSDEKTMRNWLAENIKGLGMKESSHFLRNIGYNNVAIIDFHIIDFLSNHGLIEKPKNLNRRKYLEIENILEELAEQTGTSLGELDLYLWYHETGKVLK